MYTIFYLPLGEKILSSSLRTHVWNQGIYFKQPINTISFSSSFPIRFRIFTFSIYVYFRIYNGCDAVYTRAHKRILLLLSPLSYKIPIIYRWAISLNHPYAYKHVTRVRTLLHNNIIYSNRESLNRTSRENFIARHTNVPATYPHIQSYCSLKRFLFRFLILIYFLCMRRAAPTRRRGGTRARL